eukprot:Nitzschia sp. Nitz4//scaffold43_size134323//57324//58655//NITZ4_003298-RA/size134323-processed-gene-0.47-mRNA-1//-1//CDS//3329551945//8041//frame0
MKSYAMGRWPQLSRRHSKGIMSLGLLMLAESVSMSHALSAAQQQTNLHQIPSTLKDMGGTTTNGPVGDSETCEASSSTDSSCVSAPSESQSGSNNELLAHCCSTCSHCTFDVIHACQRGGHMPSLSKSVEVVEKVATLPFGIPLNGWKVIFQAFLTTLNVVCWYVPLRSKHISDNQLALSLANAFSGGVFLSLAFGHLLPECVHGFHGTSIENEVAPYLLVLAGYLLIFFVEKVAFDAHEILHEMEHAQEKENADAGASSGRSAVILLGALAVHSVLEMVALGLADSFKDSAILTLSIALHQPAESIALLVAFLKSGMPKEQIIRFLSVFSTMGPIGVALGMAVNEFAAPVVDSIMIAIVAGTFIYVGATEVIPEEWETSEHKWKKFISLLSGIISILVVTQYTATLDL